jgi:hypothetical protein
MILLYLNIILLMYILILSYGLNSIYSFTSSSFLSQNFLVYTYNETGSLYSDSSHFLVRIKCIQYLLSFLLLKGMYSIMRRILLSKLGFYCCEQTPRSRPLL